MLVGLPAAGGQTGRQEGGLEFVLLVLEYLKEAFQSGRVK